MDNARDCSCLWRDQLFIVLPLVTAAWSVWISDGNLQAGLMGVPLRSWHLARVKEGGVGILPVRGEPAAVVLTIDRRRPLNLVSSVYLGARRQQEWVTTISDLVERESRSSDGETS